MAPVNHTIIIIGPGPFGDFIFGTTTFEVVPTLQIDSHFASQILSPGSQGSGRKVAHHQRKMENGSGSDPFSTRHKRT